MRIGDFDLQLKEALAKRAKPRPEAEAALFAAADRLLSARRERVAEVRGHRARLKDVRRRRVGAARGWFERVASLRWLALHPAAPAFALLAIAVTGLWWQGKPRGRELTFADLPEFLKSNPVPAQYDAQRMAEQKFYEREVEDAHRETNGGA